MTEEEFKKLALETAADILKALGEPNDQAAIELAAAVIIHNLGGHVCG